MIAADGTGRGDIVGGVAVPRGQFKPVSPTGQKAKLASGGQLAWLLVYASGVSGLVP